MQEIHIYLKLFVGEKKTLFKTLFAGDEREGEGHARKGSQGEGCQEKHLLGEGQTNTNKKYKKQIQIQIQIQLMTSTEIQYDICLPGQRTAHTVEAVN